MSNIVTQLPEETQSIIEIIESKYVSNGLTYGWKSSHATYDSGHWNNLILDRSKLFPYDHSKMPFIKKHPEIDLLWNILKLNLGERGISRVYINAYTFGTDGYAHQDDVDMDEIHGSGTISDTILIYLNKTWDKDWGGETVVFDDNGEIEFSILPKYLRTIMFDAVKFHSARPVTRMCGELRKVLVFKTINKNADHPAIKFLLDKTEKLPHSSKTFFEHLYNTMRILEKHKANKDLAAAGLFHSIYGTEFYKFNDQSITREQIKSLIGEYAENLVFEFCSLKDRHNVLLNNTKNYSEDFRRDLLKIEAANLYEQNNQGQYSKSLQEILTCLNFNMNDFVK